MGDPHGTSDSTGTQTVQTPVGKAPATLGIAGLGLIGGSIAAAARSRRLFDRIIGFGRSRERLEAAVHAGLIDDVATDFDRASDVDLFVSCLPVDRIVDSVRQAAAAMRPGTLLTDAGSVKASLCRDIGSEPAPGVTFLGAHPLAGSEKQGFEYADADLFQGRVCVVTPMGGEPSAMLQRVEEFWQSLGSQIVRLDPARHDEILARTSHVPHLVAAALSSVPNDEELRFGAGGFRDMTRVASGDADLWTAILLANAPSIDAALAEVLAHCEQFRSALAAGEAGAVRELLANAKSRRDLFTNLFNQNSP